MYFFVAAAADVGQVRPIRAQSGVLVQIDGDIEFVSHALAELSGEVGGFLQGDSADRYEGADVRGAHARVFAFVMVQIDEVCRRFDGLKGSFTYGFR